METGGHLEKTWNELKELVSWSLQLYKTILSEPFGFLPVLF